MIFDTHSHYDDRAFDEDRDLVMEQLLNSGVKHVVDVASDGPSLDKIPQLLRKYPMMYASYGIHPTELADLDMDETLEKIRRLSATERCVAIGEIGLDYYWDKEGAEKQKKWFLAQLALAREVDKPIIIHAREACEDTLTIMKEHAKGLSGVIHCFSYSPEIAEIYVKMGYFIGVGGVVTYKNGKRLKDTVERIPMESIVIETDCPYLTPVPKRGKRNDSGNLCYVVSEIARIKGISEEEVERITYANALRLYRLSETEA